MKEFQTSATPKGKRLDTFKVGNKVFGLYKPPDSVALVALNMASRFTPDADERLQAQALATMVDFLGACMTKSEYTRLYEILVDPEQGMDTAEMIALCRWAAETVTARPTKPSSGSPAGSSSTGGRSTGGSRSKASTRSSSPSTDS